MTIPRTPSTRIWSWHNPLDKWQDVGLGDQSDVDHRYFLARKHGIDKAAFLLLPPGEKPHGTPSQLGVPVVRVEAPATPEVIGRRVDDLREAEVTFAPTPLEDATYVTPPIVVDRVRVRAHRTGAGPWAVEWIEARGRPALNGGFDHRRRFGGFGYAYPLDDAPQWVRELADAALGD